MTSQIKGDLNCGCIIRFKIRNGLPKSTKINKTASMIHTVERIVAGLATFLNDGILNTVADDETISPPADKPTKKTNIVI